MNPKKKAFIDAFTWEYGCTKKKAAETYSEYVRSGNQEGIDIVISTFNNNARRSFYED